LQKVGRHFTSFGSGYTWFAQKFLKNSPEIVFFLKFHVRIYTEFGTKHDKFQVKRMSIHPRKKSNSSHTNEPSFQPWQWSMKAYCESCGMNLGLKSQSKLNRHSDERLVKISDQNTQGIRRSKSQTEREQNWFSEYKTSWFSSPYLLFMIRLWTCLLTWVQKTYESTCVNFFSAIWKQNKNCKK